MKTICILAILLLCVSCATVNIESRVKTARTGNKNAPVVLTVPVETDPPPVIEKERPVYVPEREASTAKAPPTGRSAVTESNQAGIVKPSEYSRAAMVYDYDADWVYEVYTQPLRATDIRLEPGEQAAEAPFISDSERWMLGAGVSYEHGTAVQHIYVKPTEASLEASLIINTDRRVYHIILRSYRDIHMPMVRWRYYSTGLPNSFSGSIRDSASGTAADGAGIDPRFLSFNYRIIYSIFKKPRWLPELVYDDGKKTYITFPESVLQKELPSIFENRSGIVNYRVTGKLIIIDKLIEELSVKIARTEITIEKKRSREK